MKISPLIAEFVGTFALIFIGVGAISADFLAEGTSGLVGIALAHGLTIAVMASATGAISGGHLNPAVTFGLLVGKKIDAVNAALYILAQCLGAVVAAFAISLAVPSDALGQVGWGIPAPGTNITFTQAFITEVVLTFFLMFVICGTAVDERAPKVGALFIGLTVTLDILMGGPISGAAMNPARHFGPALVSGNFDNIGLYWAAPLIGGMLASIVYFYVMGDRAGGVVPKTTEKVS